ncbi:FtsK/SpoIIIE domain-containing protein [Microlunatus ginsengisoli]|uniref:FtsK/SpoIIIE domain-containing protein n=2 Tax=Microlunatus ginsengisoli TaxID=363863 RepID=A0ABP7AP13_9ACTN
MQDPDDDRDRTPEPSAGELVEVPASAVLDRLDQQRGAGPVDDDAGQLVDADQDEDEGRPVTVDALVEELPAVRPSAAPRPVLPAWVKSWPAFLDAASWWLRHCWHVVAFHGIRLPLYWLRLVGRSPFGVARLLGVVWRWSTDPDGRQMRSAMNTAGADPSVFVRLTEQHRQMVRCRLLVTSIVATLAAFVGWSVITSTSPGVIAATTIAVLAVLGGIGRSADRPVTSRSIDSEAVPRLTADLIVTALGSLGIAELNKSLKPGVELGVRFPSPIMRDGPGFRAEVDLPPGVTAGDVIERRDRLASGLRRPLSSVWPSADHDTHAGRLHIWCGDKPMSRAKPVAWPLAKTGKVDLFAPFPIGTDPQGRPVTITLMFALMVIGAIPRMGKTFLLRLLALAAALDPSAELHVYDLRGGADLLPLEPVAHRFRTGDDTDDLAYLKADIRELKRDMARRYKTIRSLPRDICPEGKVTRALADKRSLGLWPIVVVIDEVQVAFDDDPELVEMVTDLGKRGPAAGIMFLLATQRVDAKSLPTGISSNAVLRFCLKVTGQVENDMVLGTSMYKAGIRATMFARTDRGVGYLAGEGDEPTIVRTAYLDAPAAEAVAARARAARLAAGLLTGHAAGIDPDPDDSTASILDHLASVWPVGEEKVWWDDLAERLAGAFPGLYGAWTGEQVTAAVRPHGLRSIQIKRTVDGKQLNRRGLARAALQAVLDERAANPDHLAGRDSRWPTYTPPVVDDTTPHSPATPDPDPGYQ